MRLSLQVLNWYSMVLSVSLSFWSFIIHIPGINQLVAITEFKHLIPGAYILGQLHLNVCIYLYLFIYVSLTEISTLSDYWDKWPWVTCGLIGECILIKGLAGVPSVPILEACQNRNTFHVSCWYIWFYNYQI